MLKNFQNALIKPYFDMGLRELARVCVSFPSPGLARQQNHLI